MAGVEANGDLERRVLAAVKASELRGDPPLLAAIEASRCLSGGGVAAGFPSPDLAVALVANLCFGHNTPSLWKLLDHAISSNVIFPLHTLSLLTPRVLPNRRAQPEAYRLYLELLSRYAVSSLSFDVGPCRDMITKSIDDALQLKHTYGLNRMDFGHALMLAVLSLISSLVGCILEDCGLSFQSIEEEYKINYMGVPQNMDVDIKGNPNTKRIDHLEQLRRTSTVTALEVVRKMTADKRVRRFLRLTHINMPDKFNGLLRRVEFLEINKQVVNNLMPTSNGVTELFKGVQSIFDAESHSNEQKPRGSLANAKSGSLLCHLTGAGRGACWIPIDIFLEHAIDGKQLNVISSVEILRESMKTLHAINEASWQETFQAMWISALRLIQRGREPLEGPIPHIEARLSILLAIIPQSIAALFKEELEVVGDGPNLAAMKQGLVSCLQSMGQFAGLLAPPSLVASAANDAASKAAVFVFNSKAGSGNLGNIGNNIHITKAVGNLQHLIVEACIARSLLDTAAYFWPGYVVTSITSKEQIQLQESPWSNFMQGTQLSGSLANALMTTPSSRVQEIEKLYYIALNGSEEERSAASRIICGASLVRGWHVQEHVVRILIKLLSPPVPSDPPVSDCITHYSSHMSMLNAILLGGSYVDTIHIVSLYGMVPDLAAALMPLCEAFGSLPPPSNHKSTNFEEASVYSVFSCSFLCLLRLWKFYKPPMEHCIAGRGGSVRMELTLDYLLLMRNSRITPQDLSASDMDSENSEFYQLPSQPVYIESFPKLRAWYLQNQACIASTLSGLSSKNPVHQVANKLLNMMCQKINKSVVTSSNISSNSSSSASGASSTSSEDSHQKPIVPAWEILEAVPFVLEAALTACAHGRLSSRDLTTGLRDLVDFLPASIAAIASYFSAEITRGIWKLVPMNGTDWPTPGAALHSVEAEVKEALASAGVNTQSCYPSGMQPALPLPMAALVSLTITFKMDRNSEYVHGIIAQALENCAAGSSWPSMPIIGALWTQKMKRWHDFVIFSCTRSPFCRDKDAVAQLISSCFSSFLGPSISGGSLITSNRGIGALLGHAITDQGVRLPIAPGFLYIRSCRAFHDTHFVSEVILKLVMQWADKLASECTSAKPAHLKSGKMTLAEAATILQQVAVLGACLLCVAGGILLVQVLYEETLPTVLLSAQLKPQAKDGSVSNILQGYGMAYMLFICGAIIWGARRTKPVAKMLLAARRVRVMRAHMDFIAEVFKGTIQLGCQTAMWQAYVACFISMLVKFVPAWIPDIKLETLCKLAQGLRDWQEFDLALALLERGGPEAMSAAVEFLI